MINDSDDATWEIQPAQKVARRALALAAITCRGSIDTGKGHPEAEKLHERLVGWVERLELNDAMSTLELERVRSKLGSLPEDVRNGMQWEVEGLCVLLWSLGLADLPGIDRKCDAFEVTDKVYFLSDDALAIVDEAELIEGKTLLAYRELMYAIHCRIRGYQRDKAPCAFGEWVQREWLEAVGWSLSDVVAGGDLKIGDVPIRKTPSGRITEAEQIINQQHRAIIWLIGEEENHWETVADT